MTIADPVALLCLAAVPLAKRVTAEVNLIALAILLVVGTPASYLLATRRFRGLDCHSGHRGGHEDGEKVQGSF